MSNKLKIVISVVILYIAVAVLYVITLLDVEPYAIQESSYVGILVTIMGIIFALLVAYQIFNTIDIKEKIRKVEVLEMDLNKLKKEMEDSIHRTNATTTSNRAIIALRNGAINSSILLFLKTIEELLQVKELNNAVELKKEIKNLQTASNKCESIADGQIKEINDTINNIISTSNYFIISDMFQQVISQLNKINSKVVIHTI